MVKCIDIIIPFKSGLLELERSLSSIQDVCSTKSLRVLCICHSDVDLDFMHKKFFKYQNVKFFECSIDGIYPAMNLGLDLSDADGVMFLGAGDILEGKIVFDDLDFDVVNVLVKSFIKIDSSQKRYGNFSRSGDIFGLPSLPFHASIIYPKHVLQVFRYETNFKIISDRILTSQIYDYVDGQINHIDQFWCNILPGGVSSSVTYRFIHLKELMFFSLRFRYYFSFVKIVFALLITFLRLRRFK